MAGEDNAKAIKVLSEMIMKMQTELLKILGMKWQTLNLVLVLILKVFARHAVRFFEKKSRFGVVAQVTLVEGGRVQSD